MKKLFFAAIAAAALMTACNKPGATTTRLVTEDDSLSYAIGYTQSQNPNEEQIKNYLMQAGSDSAYVNEFLKGIREGMEMADNKKEIARSLGKQYGMQVKLGLFPQVESQAFGGDSTRHISVRNFLAGMNDGRTDNGVLVIDGKQLTPQEAQEFVMQLMGRITAKANVAKKAASEEFIAGVAKQEGVKQLENGVCYKVLTEGNGEKPTMEQTVQVEYEGRLADGTVFDASQPGQPVAFPVGQVVEGFATALVNMPVGSEWEVYIPWNLAYGERAQGPIPAYAALIFKIKLVSIEQPAQ